MSKAKNKNPSAGRLKGLRGHVETLSVTFILLSFYYNVIIEKPAIITKQATTFYIVTTVLGFLGLAGLFYTLILRLKIRRNPHLRSIYIDDKKTKISHHRTSEIFKENWSPLKKWYPDGEKKEIPTEISVL